MTHPSDRLSAYVDGTLSKGEAAEVAAHLAQCAACRETVTDLRAVRQLVRGATVPDPPPELLPRLLRTVGTATPRPPQPVPWTLIAAGFTLAAVLLARVPFVPAAAPLLDELRAYGRLAARVPLAEVGTPSLVSTVLGEEEETGR